MENPLIEAIAELQAQALTQSTLLQAMLMAHPDPAKMKDCWDRLSAARIAEGATKKASLNRPVDEAVQYHFSAWQRRVDQAAGIQDA